MFPYSYDFYKTNLLNLTNAFKDNGHRVILTKKNNLKTLPQLPDLIISNQAWWGVEYEIGKESNKLGIPHITIEHGTPMFYQSNRQYYRRTIGSANLKLLWGQQNFDMMKRYKCSTKLLKITGNPRFDDLCKYKPSTHDVPRILFLSTWKISGKIDLIWREVIKQSEKLNCKLIYKPHPMEKYRGALINKEALPNNVRILKNEELYSEIAKASLVITAPTSVLVPIFFFKKPVYSYYPPILGKLSKGLLKFYFKFKIPHVKTMTSTINIEKLLDSKIDHQKYDNYFDYIAFSSDCNSTKRVYDCCMEFAS